MIDPPSQIQGELMPLIAQKRLKVGHDEQAGKPIYREAGDEVPEASDWSWQARELYLREGHLREVSDEDLKPESAPAQKRAPSKGKTHA